LEFSYGKLTGIFLTHCSAKKEDPLKENNIQVTPDRLYTATAKQGGSILYTRSSWKTIP